MQITSFDQNCEFIEKVCSQIEHHLQSEKKFEDGQRKNFNCALKNLARLMQQDLSVRDQHAPQWHIAYRIVRLNRMSSKIENVLNHIHQLDGPKYFSQKISRDVLPSLWQRIDDLKVQVLLNQRFPFFGARAWIGFLQEIDRQINVVEIAHMIAIEKEFFHLLGNHLNEDLLRQIDLSQFSGNWEIRAFVSWKSILNLAIKREKNPDHKKLFTFLLSVINQATIFAAKQSYFCFCVIPGMIKNGLLQGNNKENTYYEDVVSINSHEETLLHSSQKMSQKSFDQKYDISTCQIPFEVIENDLIWDMCEIISRMKKGDVRIFALGILGHRILIQITCEEDQTFATPSLFRYEIFNTGIGFLYHSTIETDRPLLSRPLTFHHLPGKYLDHFFCSKLVNMTLLESDIHCFYEFHISYLFQFLRVPIDVSYGKWYALQKYGTCTYASVEVWISSYLNAEQLRVIELIKTEISLAKQAKMIDCIVAANRDLIKVAEITDNFSRPLHGQSWKVIDLPNKLKESRLLLWLGRKYFKDLKMQKHPYY